ncbi:MAG: C-GCAxxG-C-C family protein [Candidatus Bathyarchaeia archaeon]
MSIDPECVAREAQFHFKSGFNCSESMLKAFSEALGIRNETFPMIATAFGAGIGRLSQECGVLTGGIMVIGLVHGRRRPAEIDKKERSYTIARAYYEAFKQRFGSVKCIEIQGSNLLDPKEADIMAEKRRCICRKAVWDGAYMLAKLLQQQDVNE